MLLPEEWKVVKALGGIILDQIHLGMKIFPTSLVATALLQQPKGFHFGEKVPTGTFFRVLSLALQVTSLTLLNGLKCKYLFVEVKSQSWEKVCTTVA